MILWIAYVLCIIQIILTMSILSIFVGACEIKLWFICGLKKILLNLHLEL
jgi:hypothetical protein